MKCLEWESYRPEFENPYPGQPPLQITDFHYETPLHLCRCTKALELNAGAEADYVVSQPYTVLFKLGGVDHGITVPDGMLTDLSSVPWFARWFIGRVGPHLEASIVHDFLYIAWQDLQGYGAQEPDRKFADRVFRAGMKEAGVSSWKRWIVYHAVRLLGKGAYEQPNDLRYVKDRSVEDQ